MKHTNKNYFSNFYSPLKVYVLLFFIGLNYISFDSKASIFKHIDGKNNTCYLNIQQAHQQNIPENSKSEPSASQSINLEEEDDFFTAQFYPEEFCFVVLPINLNKVINEEKLIAYFHPELTVPPPKLNTFESFC